MYDDFRATDRLTGEEVHCLYQALIMAIATRHADAVDVKFNVNGQTVWIALPGPLWAEHLKRTGHHLSDPMAVQIAGHYLKEVIENGESGREMYSLTLEQAARHLQALSAEREQNQPA
jgi:hypothetical protein